jgi:hypothetical protein
MTLQQGGPMGVQTGTMKLEVTLCVAWLLTATTTIASAPWAYRRAERGGENLAKATGASLLLEAPGALLLIEFLIRLGWAAQARDHPNCR